MSNRTPRLDPVDDVDDCRTLSYPAPPTSFRPPAIRLRRPDAPGQKTKHSICEPGILHQETTQPRKTGERRSELHLSHTVTSCAGIDLIASCKQKSPSGGDTGPARFWHRMRQGRRDRGIEFNNQNSQTWWGRSPSASSSSREVWTPVGGTSAPSSCGVSCSPPWEW